MPYAKNGDVNIYYEVEGEGLPLVLLHGLGDSLNIWRDAKYTEALENDYKLILLDARGHGRSDKSYEVSECYPSVLATDVLTILDDVGITQTHYFGYSLGARVGFWLAVHHPERFRSFILGGMTPYNYDEAAIKSTNTYIEALKLHRTDPDAYLQKMEQFLKHALSSEEKEGLLSLDSELSIALTSGWFFSPPLSNEELERISFPCLVFCGELDQGGFYPGAKECASHIPNAEFVSFPDLDHPTLLSRSDIVLPYVKEFLAKVSE